MTTISMSLLRGTGEGGGEISLEGSSIITKGSSEEYKITDYDSFSDYAVRASSGFTASISEDKVTVNIPSGYEGNQAVFFVSRNGAERAFTVGMDTQTLVTPRIVSPANGAADQSTNITVSASSYTTIPSGIGSLAESHWQLSLTQTFTDTIRDVRMTSGNMQQTTFSELPVGTELFLRVRYRSSESHLGWSDWSSVSSFTTINESIAKPRISLDQPPFDVNDSPVFTTDAFTTVPSGRDSHLSSSWRIIKVENDGSETTIFSRLRSMEDKVRLEVPKGVLEVSSEYYAQVKFEGSRIGESMWSNKLLFSTATSFVPTEIGTPWEGGYYAGRIMLKGQPKAIVISSRQEGGQATGLEYKVSHDTPQPADTRTRVDGESIMAGAVDEGINNYPAFKFCYEFRGGGYDDWHLPAARALEIIYRNLKPTSDKNSTSYGENPNAIPPTENYTENNPTITEVPLFRAGQPESFRDSNYEDVMSSTSLYTISLDGTQGHWVICSNSKDGSQRYMSKYRNSTRRSMLIRPIRYVDISI